MCHLLSYTLLRLLFSFFFFLLGGLFGGFIVGFFWFWFGLFQ